MRKVLIPAGVLVLATVGYLSLRQENQAPEPVRAEAPRTARPAAPANAQTEIAEAKAAPNVAVAPQPAAEPQAQPVPEAEPDHANEAELQPRDYYVADFRGLNHFPHGFEAENVVLTDAGFQLKPAEPGRENEPRIGTLVSPPERPRFPSNAFSPLWRENLPDGTSINMEVAFSPDGTNWTDWRFADPDEDSIGQMNEYYHDGSRNPNYGYTPAGVFVWGEQQWQYMRYRATLTAEGAESPTLEAVRMFYQDSTMGTGRLAQVEDTYPPSDIPEETVQ